MNQLFTSDLNDPQSQGFHILANNIKNVLLPVIQASVPSAVDIQVTGFTNGSINADFHIIIDSSAPGNAVNASQIEFAMQLGIIGGNFSTLYVPASFVFVVTG